MRRRTFITGIAGTAAAWPHPARTQLQLPVIGILENTGFRRLAAFREGLSEGGLIEGRNVAIEHRSAQQYAELPALAKELVQRRVAVIAALGGLPAKEAKAATAAIPIVFSVGGDPVKLGLVSSLNRPGGNLTGASFFAAQLLQKQVGIVLDLVPKATVIGVLINPSNPRHQTDRGEVQAAAGRLGLQVQVAEAGSKPDFDAAFVLLSQHKIGALIIAGDAFFSSQREQIVALAARHTIPTMYNLHTNDVQSTRLCGGRRPCELRSERGRRLSSGRHLCCSHCEG